MGRQAVIGPAADGELEDHAVTFVSGASRSVSFKAADLGPHEVMVSNGSLVVRSGGSTRWSAPATEIAKFATLSAINSTKSLQVLMDAANTLVAVSSWTNGTESGAWVQPYTSIDATIEIVNAGPWQNEVNSFDVDDDNGISPLDVLSLIHVINLNSFPNGSLPSRGSSTSKNFFDTNGDGRVDPLDVLKVNNELNRSGSSEGEGVGEGSVKVIQAESPMSRAMIDRAMAADLDSMLGDMENERVGKRQARHRHLSR
jgi:hypothetical protein